MIKYILIVVFLLNGCSNVVSHKLGMYKVFSGITTTDKEDDSSWVELTYHGYEDESTTVALNVWLEKAKGKCPWGKYKLGTLSLSSQVTTSQNRKHFNNIIVSYPEDNNEKWPQVSGLIKCK